MDLFDDGEPSASKARVKFQPKKAKARAPPAKKASAAANPLVPQQAAVDPPVADVVPENDTLDSADIGSDGAKAVNNAVSIECTANLQTLSSADPLVFSMENGSAVSGSMEENVAFLDGINPSFHYGESTIESAEIFIGLDSVDDSVPQSTNVTETLTEFPDHENEEQLSYKDSNAGDIEAKGGLLETKGGHASSSFESLDLMSEVGSAVKKASKFQPKIKQNRGKKKVAVESVSDPMDTFVVPSEPQNSNLGSVDEGLNFPDVRADPLSTETDCLLNQEEWLETPPDFTPDLPSCTDAATDCLLNQASQLPQSPGIAAEASDILIVNEAENNNGQEEKGGSKKKKASSRSKKDANGTRKSVRKRKKKTEAIEKSNENTTEASEKSSEQPPKKFSRTTRRKTRCIDKALLETPEDEIDYQNLPIRDLILLAEHREKTQLAEGKKADTNQNALPANETTVATEPVKSTSNNLWDDPYDEYGDMYNDAQAEGSFDDPSTSAVERDTSVFNYHSHMHRTPRVKWSKQDTELFYEAVREFGSDLSMINHLFPDRTRQQIKLKYKKEERQQPMKLLDALTNRTKDFSHYKLVIGRLQEKIDREEEELIAQGEEIEGDPEEDTADDTQEPSLDEAAKSEQNDGSGAVEDPGEVKVGSPTASNESEFDMGDWSEYKSDF